MDIKYIIFAKLSLCLFCELKEFRFEFRGICLVSDVGRQHVPVTYSRWCKGAVVASEARVDCLVVDVYTSAPYCNWFRYINSFMTILVQED